MWLLLQRAVAWTVTAYKAKRKFRTFVQAVEGALIVGFLEATSHGFELSRMGLHDLLVAMGSAAVVAVRNWLLIPTNGNAVPPPPPPQLEEKKP